MDDHPLVWEGIKAVLEDEKDIEVIGCACSGKEAEQLFNKVNPDIALVDLRLPGEYGIDIIKKLRPQAPGCRFAVLTTYAEPEDINRAMSAKVDGYILKEALPEEMVSAIRLIGRGRPYFDPSLMQLLLNKAGREKNPFEELTGREREVLEYLAQGLSNKEIAGLIYVSEHTVKKHISSILSKLELKDRTQAALFAANHGLGKM